MGRAINKSYFRLFSDPKSHTGVSAAILIKGIRPKKTKIPGEYIIAAVEFNGVSRLNCDGIMIKPTVKVEIRCIPTLNQSQKIRKRKMTERAMSRCPMLA